MRKTDIRREGVGEVSGIEYIYYRKVTEHFNGFEENVKHWGVEGGGGKKYVS
jgi:hypothetical protein